MFGRVVFKNCVQRPDSIFEACRPLYRSSLAPSVPCVQAYCSFCIVLFQQGIPEQPLALSAPGGCYSLYAGLAGCCDSLTCSGWFSAASGSSLDFRQQVTCGCGLVSRMLAS